MGTPEFSNCSKVHIPDLLYGFSVFDQYKYRLTNQATLDKNILTWGVSVYFARHRLVKIRHIHV